MVEVEDSLDLEVADKITSDSEAHQTMHRGEIWDVGLATAKTILIGIVQETEGKETKDSEEPDHQMGGLEVPHQDDKYTSRKTKLPHSHLGTEWGCN